MRGFIIGVIVLCLVAAGVWMFIPKQPLFVPVEAPTAEPMYQSVGKIKSTITLVSEQVPNISQIEITSDGNTMLIGTLPGKIFVYQKVDGVFRRQSQEFFDLQTAQPGWPPQEAGLTGIVLAADFDVSGDVFLMYSYAFEKKSFRNRVMRVTLTKRGGRVIATNAKQIFEANAPGTGSHQIQDGVGVSVAGKPYVLFTVGEGFVAERALDPTQEAGKVLVIDRDGNAPPAPHAFEQNGKVAAIGIRNAPAIAKDHKNDAIAIGDTGPNNFDRFIYGSMMDWSGSTAKPLSFNWDGTEGSLQKGASDLYDGNKEMILHRWAPTETLVNIAFYESNTLPKLGTNQQYLLATFFGKTGEKANTPGKSIQLATLTHGLTSNSISFAPFIARTESGEGKLGHPLGLAVDQTNGDIYFGDIIDGRLYKAVIE